MQGPHHGRSAAEPRQLQIAHDQGRIRAAAKPCHQLHPRTRSAPAPHPRSPSPSASTHHVNLALRQLRLQAGEQVPVQRRAEEAGDGRGDAHVPAGVVWARLQHQHPLGAALAQAVGQHAGGGAAAHQDIIVLLAAHGGRRLRQHLFDVLHGGGAHRDAAAAGGGVAWGKGAAGDGGAGSRGQLGQQAGSDSGQRAQLGAARVMLIPSTSQSVRCMQLPPFAPPCRLPASRLRKRRQAAAAAVEGAHPGWPSAAP